ncbi:hypothetical protein WISP_35788 [Willisornis vidua]|uniref:Uncharacterized protein n=1 Tax=Willisornis vidua TaxID=1566151 RepID=A0ABQ9DIL9_9PASS|nr:hypothetical protein WISP_35788 [Willisornis vidua]
MCWRKRRASKGEYKEERQKGIDSTQRGAKALGQQELKGVGSVWEERTEEQGRVQEGEEEEGFEVDNTNTRLGKGPEVQGKG